MDTTQAQGPPTPQPLLTAEAARLLRINEMTCRRWAAAGKLDVRRTESGVRIFDRAQCERLAAERAAKPK